ncbi:MAG TPA: hypothetical protein VER17_04620 [Tepidisphaeraceae bacterium]|nr:hypothetical protein [Tepidisphaeraceae bacterium]
MLRYTARNGTTFHLDPDAARCVQVISAECDGSLVSIDLDDLREFLAYADDVLGAQREPETDADCAAIGPD